jgi:hypothetical protein
MVAALAVAAAAAKAVGWQRLSQCLLQRLALLSSSSTGIAAATDTSTGQQAGSSGEKSTANGKEAARARKGKVDGQGDAQREDAAQADKGRKGEPKGTSSDRKESSSSRSLFKLKSLPAAVQELLPDAEQFMLAHVPEHLPRERQGSRDARVKFVPDPWQRHLLDVIDAGAGSAGEEGGGGLLAGAHTVPWLKQHA